jgi:hypothetical protein
VYIWKLCAVAAGTLYSPQERRKRSRRISVRPGAEKAAIKAQIAQNDGMKIARIAPGLLYLCFPASDDRTEKIRISGNNILISGVPYKEHRRRNRQH